jgi:hypothetical protein
MNINSLITEWTYRLTKGYPDSESDYQELDRVLNEMTDLSETERMAIIRKAKGLSEQEDDESQDILDTNEESIRTTLNNIGLPNDIITQVMSIYSQLSNNEQTEFNKNFRKHSIESYVNSGWKAFKEFFLVNVGGARGGMGNGEISILLGVKESMPGGTAQHDIVMPAGEWEVKELKSGKFDPAKAGLSSKYALTSKIKDFYKDIVVPVSQIGDPYQSLKHLVNPESAEDLKKLIRIFETRFESVIDPDKLASFEWKKSAMHNWYEGFKELHDVFYKTNLDTTVKDTRLTVNADGKQKSYWISDEDVEEIELSAGEDTAADVYVGDLVDDINSNIVIWFKRVERHEFIKNPQNFLFDLNTGKNTFFNSILGLIWYNYRNPQPHIGLAEDFAIDVVSQGRYRFVQKNIPSSQGYEYIQGQG